MAIVDREEQALIEKAQAGDTNAFASLVTMHGTLVYNLALRTLSDAQEAEDVAQETSLPRLILLTKQDLIILDVTFLAKRSAVHH